MTCKSRARNGVLRREGQNQPFRLVMGHTVMVNQKRPLPRVLILPQIQTLPSRRIMIFVNGQIGHFLCIVVGVSGADFDDFGTVGFVLW